MGTSELTDYGNMRRLLFAGELGIPAEQVEAANHEARRQGVSLWQAVTQQTGVDEAALLTNLASAGNLPFSELREDDITPEAVARVPAGVALHYRVMPISLIGDAVLIATHDPFAADLMDELSLLTGGAVAPALAPLECINRALRQHYGVGADTVEQMVTKANLPDEELVPGGSQGGDDASAAHDASVIKLLNQILADAIHQRATDIHFEPFEDELRVRYRIDGVLREAGVPSAAKHFRHALVSRAKIISNLDIAERRMPQDGRSQLAIDGQFYDLRISVLPTPHGEALNLRILPRGTMIDNLSTLGFEGRDLDELNRLIEKPHGIILVTGPTGSGKTTTLYTVLSQLNSAETKILTIEDPIEYRMRGLVQMQVNPEIGFTFARALRSMLRHDPDVMLIGEIRDYETAEITIRTALTGHLVFSTLHTNDAPTAMSRLTDMGVEPFLIASSVEGVQAQRLVRLICPRCKEYYTPEEGALAQLGDDAKGLTQLARGAGCRECRFTGYMGRTCITELMIMDRYIREMVTSKRHADDIRREAARRGMQSLRQSGIRKIARGLTTVDEVLRVTPSPESDTIAALDQG